ncbi:pentapeptide repeat protein [Candidatus Nitrosopumilus salaria BD31]|uniref:Pentapeptide repeat protein n=1 Tax=Candidatus Nitrosopumilus salarius BD31 TaxID=859350 RepID=I3CZR3_9ARCH|nr:pentapeptide repeat-containing protein [Candidatus Nitrosopumilus salaria]EIJ64956.1 pentapeptide repeat protein [Candidatus Nitrosopumilus salaria BD31]
MRKLRVFISSKTQELHDARMSIKECLKPFNFEVFIFEDDAGARTESSEEVYRTEVSECDIYIGLFREDHSEPTEEEYDIANKNKKEILCYISEYNINQRDKKLDQFIGKIRENNTYDTFDNVKELEQKIQSDMAKLLAKKFIEAQKIPNKTSVFGDKETIQEYLQKICTTNPSSLASINQIASEVMLVWNAMGYSITNCQIDGSTVNFSGKYDDWSGSRKVFIRCVDGSADSSDVVVVNRFLNMNPKFDEGFIFTHQRVSESALEKAKEFENITIQSQFNFYRNILNPESYFQWLKKYYDSSEISKFYVDLNCFKEVQSNGPNFVKEDFGNLEKYVDGWLKDKTKKHLSILGEFGSGKTWFSKKYAKICLDRYLEDPESNRIPILISLRDYAKSYSIKQMITDLLLNEYGFKIRGAFDVFEELNNQGKFLLIFDGFDEMAQKVDYDTVVDNFWELAKVATPNSKVLLTCRTTYFRYEMESQKVLSGKEQLSTSLPLNQPGFEIIHLKEFDESQVIEVMSKRIGNKEQAIEYWEKLKPIYDIPSIAHKPVLIPMLIEVMSDIIENKSVDPSTIYYTYVNRWLKKAHEEKRTFLKTKSQSLFFVTSLAWYMIKSQNLRIHWKKMPEFIDQHFNVDSSELDYYAADLRTNSFLKRDEDGVFEFTHKSMTEFFTAYKFAIELGAAKKQFLTDISNEDRVQKPLPDLIESFGAFILTPEISLFLRDMVSGSHVLKELFERSRKKGDTVGFLNSNLISLLVQMGESIDSQNMFGINLPNAELENCKLTNCILDGSNLQHCLLDGSNLHKSKLNNCNLAGASFQHSNFVGVEGDNVNITNCKGRRSNFKNAILTGANFSNSQFQKSKFIYSILDQIAARNSDFTGTDFTESNFENSTIDNCIFDDCILTGTTFKNANLTNCSFFDAVLTKIELTNVNLKKSKFENHEFVRVGFGAAKMNSTIMINCVFDHCRYNNANLYKSNFRDSKFIKCKFEQTDMNSSNFVNATLSDVIFEGCNLTNSDFTGIKCEKISVDKKTTTKGIIMSENTFRNLPQNFKNAVIRDNPIFFGIN